MVEGGRLKLDETALDGRLLGKLGEVRRVFEFGASSSSGDLSVYARTNALADTSFTVAITDADGDGQAESATIDGVAALLSGGTIQGADGTAYEGLKLIWTGSGSAAIDMRVSPGVADRLYNALDQVLDLTDGPLQRAMGELDAANSRLRQADRPDQRACRPGARAVDGALLGDGIGAQPRQDHADAGARPDGCDERPELKARMSQVQTHSRATAAYRDAEAHPPARQIVLLHESAIRNLLDAKLAIAERRIEDRFHRVTRAHAIVGALQSSLDFELGGEIAPLLDRLYDHILGRLMSINLQDDPAICDEIVQPAHAHAGRLGRDRGRGCPARVGATFGQRRLRVARGAVGLTLKPGPGGHTAAITASRPSPGGAAPHMPAMSVKAPPPRLQRTGLGGPSRVGPTSFGRGSIRMGQAQDSRSGRALIYRFPVRQVGCRSFVQRQVHRRDAARGPLAPGSRMNGLHRAGYRLAFALLRLWWFVRRPEAQGAAVAVWHGGRLLLVRMSYRPELDLPGGGIEAGETPLEAALRELREETGLLAGAAELEPAGAFHFEDYHRRITHAPFPLAARRARPAGGRRARDRLAAKFHSPAELAASRLAKLPRLYLASSARLPSGTCQTSRA